MSNARTGCHGYDGIVATGCALLPIFEPSFAGYPISRDTWDTWGVETVNMPVAACTACTRR
jgi:hypothetical protein